MRYLLLSFLVVSSAFAEPPASMPLDETARAKPIAERSASALHYEIEAALSRDASEVSGRVRITFRNTAAVELRELVFWQYPNRFSVRSPSLSEINQPSYYRGAFSAASMKTSNINVEGNAVTAVRCEAIEEAPDVLCAVTLQRALPPHQTGVLSLAFTTQIPERYGRLGREMGVVMLDGGFYPTLAALSPQGFDTTSPPLAADYSLRLTAPEWGGSSFVNGEGPLASPVSRELVRAAYASWILYPPHHVREILVMNDAKTEVLGSVSYFYFDSLYRDRVDAEGREAAGPPGLDVDVWRDYPTEVAEAAAKGLAFLLSLGVTLPSTELRLIEVPIREHISRATLGLTLVSDRAMKVSPGKGLLKFHTLQILRSLYAVALEDKLRAVEPARDLQWVCDALGSYLSDLYHYENYEKANFAKEILKPVSFISEFDRLRWLPQVPFQDAYFKTAYEKDLFRDDVRRFPSEWPYGKFIYQKYKALLGEARFGEFARDYLTMTQRPFRELSAEYYGGPLEWFYTQWLREHPRVNYKLVSMKSVPIKDGFQNTVIVQREGDTWVKEPIEVFCFFADESFALKSWPLDAVEYTFSFISPSELKLVKLDPSELLHEEINEAWKTAKLDNDSSISWRPVLDGFYADASSGGLNFLASASTRIANNKRHFYFIGTQLLSGERRALTSDVSLRVDDVELISGGYRRGFGASLNEDKLKNTLSVILAAQRLGPRILTEEQLAIPSAALGKLSLVWRYNDRQSIYLSWGGLTAETSLSYLAGGGLSLTLPSLAAPLTLQRPCDAEGLCQSVSVVSSIAKLFSLDGGRVLGFRANAAAIFGSPFSQDLFDLAGEKNLKGYPLNTIEGRARVFGGIEYRHPLFRGLDVNLVEVDRWRSLSAVLWCTGASISGAQSILQDPARRLFSRESFFAEAGLGLRFWSDIAGVDPAILSLNLAAPLVGNSAFGDGPFAPVQLHVGFEENF